MKNILIVDNNPVMLHTLTGLLKSQSHFFNIIPALGVQKAVDILSIKEIHLLILGIQLPQEDAFHLALLMSGNARMRIIMMTHNASPELKRKIRENSAVIHFDHARDISVLAKRIFNELRIDFGGQLHGMSLSSILQMMELEKRSGTLLVTTKGRFGTLTIVDGKPIAARFGQTTGTDAAMEILTWENISIDIDYMPPQATSEIDASLMNLLLASGKRSDDKRSRIVTLRKHKLYDRQLSAEFQVKDWTFQCCLHDISEGGAYIETSQPVQVGQQLVLSLDDAVQGGSRAIAGKVVRRDAKGIGIRFEPLNPEQKQFILSLVATCKTPDSAD
ncbi:hypothetical protein DESC_660139 [Desulfosarcina cetonica]|uniref:PilZ domain-containing protein n=1 Tax=Desulfosarcina cetonica TaxID=90730 RepID=UPI0006D057A1|nr:PilZ domain-containing protein [Desulfosarcina cetonica]VTR68012.1 hypothetical protein DESC_660139 [Desulfosarcina cetonica]